MDFEAFAEELALEGRVMAITRIAAPGSAQPLREACTLAALHRAMRGERVVVTAENARCAGGATGFGLCDGLPDIPGGFAHFLSYGRGEGFPAGERIKRNPEIAEEMMRIQPKNVMGGLNALEFCPYTMAVHPDLVSALVSPDQLSALVHIFNFEKPDYDNVILPMASGCASVVRIPLGEAKKGTAARAVVGNVDIFSRLHFPEDTFFFTVPATAFHRMLEIAGESVLASPIWKGVQKRLHKAR